MKKICQYLRELSIIVLGVAFTIAVTLGINRWYEKRDLSLYLNAIKIEMEENLTIVEDAREYLLNESNYEAYLSSHDNPSFNNDTLEYYMA